MKNFRIAFLGVCALASVACGRSVANIEGLVSQAPESEIIAAKLDVNVYSALDTIKTDANGAFSYKIDVLEGQPEFLYFFHNGTKIASLLLEKGDKVSFSADTLGNWTVEGSDESLRLLEVEKSFAEFARKMNSTTESASLTRMYIDYYRDRVKYIMQNPFSMTTIPVLYQSLAENFQIFGQVNDAMHFRRTADSLMTIYPDSKYVKALDREAVKRMQMMEFNGQLSVAKELGYPDFTLADNKGEKVTLSQIDSKVIMLYFWASSEAEQKMFNIEVIKPLYEKYHDKGFEIVAVSLDGDKTAWASAVRNQELPWINLWDGNGKSAALYNIVEIPASFLIVDGNLSTNTISGEAGLRRELDRLLK